MDDELLRAQWKCGLRDVEWGVAALKFVPLGWVRRSLFVGKIENNDHLQATGATPEQSEIRYQPIKAFRINAPREIKHSLKKRDL